MVSTLKKFKTDPNQMGRGPGMYYHRGNGYYSKYSYVRDSEVYHTKKKTTNFLRDMQKSPHMADYRSRIGRKKRLTTYKKIKGYF